MTVVECTASYGLFLQLSKQGLQIIKHILNGSY